MQTSITKWRSLFLFCLGISVSTIFILQWLESDLWVNDEKFSVPGLELFYSKRELLMVFTQLKPGGKVALDYRLIFDFVFMAGFYPGIASLCMIARENISRRSLQTILFALAILQPVAWTFDIVSKSYLLKWLKDPEIGDELSIFHNVVVLKWLIAIAGLLLSIISFFFGHRTKYDRSKN